MFSLSDVQELLNQSLKDTDTMQESAEQYRVGVLEYLDKIANAVEDIRKQDDEIRNYLASGLHVVAHDPYD